MDIRTSRRVLALSRKFLEADRRAWADALGRRIRAEARLGQLVGGSPYRDHLEHVEKTTGRRSDALHPPPLPPGSERTWTLFVELSNARQAGFNGPAAISWQDMLAYSTVTRHRLEPWEISIVRGIDAAYLDEVRRIQAETNARA